MVKLLSTKRRTFVPSLVRESVRHRDLNPPYSSGGSVKLTELSAFPRRKRSALERRINNLETSMNRLKGAQPVNLTVPHGCTVAVGFKPGIDQDRILIAQFVPERGSLGKILHPTITQLEYKKKQGRIRTATSNTAMAVRRGKGRRGGRADPPQYLHPVSIAHLGP